MWKMYTFSRISSTSFTSDPQYNDVREVRSICSKKRIVQMPQLVDKMPRRGHEKGLRNSLDLDSITVCSEILFICRVIILECSKYDSSFHCQI